ncbi:MAG TPA: alpha-2-macroglobulin family protein [Puia sp.]|nr:alpha-2-macroglobulin family protein [Puia sp.]
MRIRLLIPTLLFFFFSGKAQNDLSGSQRQSPFVYAWRISDKEALYLYNHHMKNWEKNNLHTLSDSFPSSQLPEPALAPGNYLLVQSRGSYLAVTLRTMGSLRYDLLNNGRNASLLLHTPGGGMISDAEVFVRRHKVGFDSITGAWPLGRWNKSRPVKVIYQTALYFFPVTNAASPTRHRWFLTANRPSKYRSYYPDNTAYERRFRSFLVFNKPKFKPGDTVEGKAFVMNASGRPIDRPLILRLSDGSRHIDTLLGELKPYRPGGYTFSIVLKDSLDLRLDHDYTTTLEEVDSRKKKEAKVLCRGSFHYEEYELRSIHFEARVDKKEHGPGEPVSVFLRAADENDLPVPDGRVELEVLTSGSARKFLADTVFIRDKLWSWSQPLDPVGETRIIIPDSIFPAASFDYTIRCHFLNSNNEAHDEQFHQFYQGDTGRIAFRAHRDSLDIAWRVQGKSLDRSAMLYVLASNSDVIETRQLSLPVSLSINSFAARYVIRTKGYPDSITDSYAISARPPLTFGSDRTRDSIHIVVDNPWSIHFWYTLSVDSRRLSEGYSDRLDYAAATATGRPYLLRVQYIWGGEVRREDRWVPFRERSLQIDIKEPAFVYPGQQAAISIGVKDADGRPVADADLTAWSRTAKFTGNEEPAIPYFGRRYRYKRSYDYITTHQTNTREISEPLQWRRWSRQLGLDTIEYYKFLNPAKLYINQEPAAGNLTQLAPFVSRKGQLEPVQLIYIDEKLVFFSKSQQLPRYSFPLEPGIHSLRLRTTHNEIRLDSFRTKGGMKTFICINDDTANTAIRLIKKPDTLTASEEQLVRSSMLFMANTFDYHFATISQGNRHYLLNSPGTPTSNSSFLVGPFSDQQAELQMADRYKQPFDPEGGFLFDVQPGLVKEKQLPFPYRFHTIDPGIILPDLKDQVLTRAFTDSLWQDFIDNRSATQDLFRNRYINTYGDGVLHIGDAINKDGAPLFIKKIFLFRYNDPDYMRIYKGMDRDLGHIEEGVYRLMVLLRGDGYLIRDSIRVQPEGLNYYGTACLPVQAPDSFSRRISAMLRKMEEAYTYASSSQAGSMQQVFNERYLDITRFMQQVTGKVMDDKGVGLMGVTVMLKNTRHGVTTDQYGNFTIKLPEHGTLVFSYIGFARQEKEVHPGQVYAVKLQPARYSLDEVVVVGYGTEKRKDLTGSVSMALQGRVAGLEITQNTKIMIRGISTLHRKSPGFSNQQDPLPADTLGIPSIGEPMTGSTLRTHFRDDAFWQPRLRTDANGMATFTVVYPDDITDWKTCAVAMTADRQSGSAAGHVRAFKPLSASLSLPNFLVEGDEAHVIGKVLNYTPDPVTVVRTFSINGKTTASNTFPLLNSHIDTFTVKPQGPDSLQLLYSLKKDDYLDGEQRPIPVYPTGVKETRGTFAVLEEDTSLRLTFDTALGPVHVYASASLLPVMLDEIESLQSYEYFCNEQVASKLIALLQKKKIYILLQKDFKEDKNINELINRLLKARKGGALWGWWPDGAPTAWISLHVTDALLMAQKEGYNFALDKQPVIDYLINQVETDPYTSDGLFRIRLLQQLGAHATYSKYIDSLEKRLENKTLYETLQLQELRQEAGLPLRLDTLVTKRQYTALGNTYWGEDNMTLFNNAVQNTVLMYRLLRRAGGYSGILKKIRDYLLEQRGQGHWRNTYESSLILETLLPDLLDAGQTLQASTLHLNGQRIPSFPYQAQLPAGQPMDVRESGKLPVYFTAYQQFQNKTPEKVSGTFAVSSWFEQNGVVVSRLTAGKRVTLQVEVDVKGDADYVLVEIPIPAGCSYEGKEQSYGSQEAHREYFKDKLSIFSLFLTKGLHTFSVSLLPRFTGAYHLNPATAELMYFPVLYGREGLRMVRIE